MTTRSIVLGCLGLATLLGGCFEDPISNPTTSDSTGASTTTDTTTSLTGTTGAPTTTTATGPTTGPTSSPTTTGPLDTTADETTMGVEVTDSDSTGPVDPCESACDGLACGLFAGCDCGTCSLMSTCAADQTYCAVPIGFFNDFGATAQVGGQLQLGFRFQVFEGRRVRRLGVISRGAGVNVRLALYNHDGLGPDTRIVQTGAVALYANGVNEFDVGATDIVPGDYWVMLHTEGSTQLARTFNGDNGHEEALRTGIPFADGFPAMMTDEMVINDYRYNLYMVVED